MNDKLKEYNKKRNFQKTSEPSGKVENKNTKKLIFTIQYHLARREHYDFRLEYEGVLLSWAVPKGPSYNPKDKRLAIKVEDHPIDYANFEGTIPKGEYGGGTVMLWDKGYYIPLNNFKQGLKHGSLKFEIFGKRIKGKWTLVKIENQNNEQDAWLLIKENDEYKKNVNGIENFVTSVKTGRTSEDIAHGISPSSKMLPFSIAQPQLAKLSNQIPKGKDWIFEIKFDGYRILSYIENGSVKMMTRNNHDYSSKFEQVADSLSKFFKNESIILDGEIVVVDENGKTDFQALQNSIKGDSQPLTYIVFDILAKGGNDLRELPLLKRKQILSKLLKKAPPNIVYSQQVKGNGEKCFEFAKQNGLEGIIAKKENSKYSGERNDDWLKIKCYQSQEFVIGGYTISEKKFKQISSLLLGYYKNDKLIYIGRTGTGMTEQEIKQLKNKFSKLKRSTPPFVNSIDKKSNEQVFYLTPKIVAQIQYAEITKDFQLRQASYKGLRLDKEAKQVVLEDKKIHKSDFQELIDDIKISNPEKIVFKKNKITKFEIIKYYEKISKKMLPFLENRILTVVRCHGGIENCFFKKHPTIKNEYIKTIDIKNSEGEKDEYFYIENKQGLIFEAQQGTIEFHVWGSQIKNLEKPDMMVFDFDPDEKMDLKQIRQGVKDLKKILDQLNLKSFLKTSGGKGYHVVVPFKPKVDWETFYSFAKKVASILEEKYPDKYTTNIRKANRKNKIFIDWVRNGRGATSVAPYSLRARDGASVSCPISWKELDKIAPNQLTMQDVLKRKGNPWKSFYGCNQQLNCKNLRQT